MLVLSPVVLMLYAVLVGTGSDNTDALTIARALAHALPDMNTAELTDALTAHAVPRARRVAEAVIDTYCGTVTSAQQADGTCRVQRFTLA